MGLSDAQAAIQHQRLKVDLGFWGESFYVTSDGRCGVTDCNGDAVELEADQWRHVITLLTAHIDTPQKLPVVTPDGP